MRIITIHSTTSIMEVADMWILDFKHTESSAVSMMNSSMYVYVHPQGMLSIISYTLCTSTLSWACILCTPMYNSD